MAAGRNANLRRICLLALDRAVRFYERNGLGQRTNDMEHVILTRFENS
ncbi:MAG: hypothetical protein SGJ09_13725 [Phycisphaerae bacterium]|nr:hypothetical protein [Phycisphaerae bacterium]